MAPGLKRFTDVAADGTPRLDDAAGRSSSAWSAPPQSPSAAARRSPGTLFITTRRVIWLSEAEKDKGYVVDFLDITLHAVSRDPGVPSPCLYTQIEAEANSDEEGGDMDAEAYGDSQLPKISELRIILADAGQLDSLFDAFCHCAELNPDPTAEENEDSDLFYGEGMVNGGWIHGDEDEHMVDGQNGGDDLSSSVLELQINDRRFEDADEEEARENGH
ncbi:hypothetical protein ZWY2020_007988 [Hordeum vulgare]|nr:hypothetical protein ZWY2020_007988 [Hordeum vulgare]